jgi:putative transposase
MRESNFSIVISRSPPHGTAIAISPDHHDGTFTARTTMIDYFSRKRFFHYNTPGHAHELTFWCLRHARLFDEPLARELFMQELDRARAAYRFRLHAWVIMPTHVHMLIVPIEQNYDIMRIRNGVRSGFARRYRAALRNVDSIQFERCTGKNTDEGGLIFWEQGGGEDRNLWNAGAIRDSMQYIEANPVRSLLAESPEEWPASSAYARTNKIGLVPDNFSQDLPRIRVAGMIPAIAVT